ncbi:MAG: VanW family protein [Aggregatilineales bacterium]
MTQSVYPIPQAETDESGRWTPWLVRLPLLTFGGATLFLTLLLLFVAVHQVQYDGLIYPGVSAYGISLGGMARDEAVNALTQRFTYGTQAVFTFRDGAKSWQLSAADLGVSFDPKMVADQSLAVGRSGGFVRGLLDQWHAWVSGKPISPTIVYDQSRAAGFLQQIAVKTDRLTMDATILLKGTTVSTTVGQIGRTLDVNATLGLLREVILNMNTGAEIPLVIHETPPAIQSAEDAAAQVRAALASPIQLYVDNAKAGEGPWQLAPNFIGGLLSIQRVDDGNGKAHYGVTANISPVQTLLQGLATQLHVDPVDARFVFDDTTKQLQVTKDSVNGRSLDTNATLSAIQAALFRADNRKVALAFHEEIPAVNSRATAQQLGITEQIVAATTHFYGSTDNRRTNIQVAASRFQGLVIKPGQIFSFDQFLGDVSPEGGYQSGLVIFGNQTITGVGGGVCQVSTTMFQAAFFAGLPIQERYAHGYRVGYYESGSAVASGQLYNSGVGLDATVYAPQVDLVFTNDTPYYILIQEFFDPAQQALTFKFYSTSTGRVVTKDGPYISNQVPHGPAIYKNSPDVAAGHTQQVDYSVDGADVHVYRTVTQNGKVLISHEDFFSHYLPWQAVFLVGGTSHN